ncbi:DUF2259 domain-containing protein [Deinococcus sp. HMF7620]|uniref:DUF2259 domain-containing protein n=1 Tax=Deinococcus arboris TaxID=2682977 RepID=A0A7C9LM97_9DEIO|nr:DUF2259 domain-containing protein [Deinococcus arboris]MVN87217.1 DUF2259 domain-containing protein [Deinococcus arboris]
MRRPLIALLTISALWASAAQANERLPVAHIQFSATGERVVTVVSGERDGSGFGYAALNVLSTGSGQTLANRTRTGEDQSAPQVRQALLNEAATQTVLRGAGLTLGKASVPRYTRAYATPYPRWQDGLRPGVTQVTPVKLWSRAVPVSLKVVPLRAQSCAYPDFIFPGERPAGFELRINGQLIYQDTLSSPGRNCAVRYSLERVDVQGNRVLVTLRAYSMGFEGPDAAAVFVAATLK